MQCTCVVTTVAIISLTTASGYVVYDLSALPLLALIVFCCILFLNLCSARENPCSLLLMKVKMEMCCWWNLFLFHVCILQGMDLCCISLCFAFSIYNECTVQLNLNLTEHVCGMGSTQHISITHACMCMQCSVANQVQAHDVHLLCMMCVHWPTFACQTQCDTRQFVKFCMH